LEIAFFLDLHASSLDFIRGQGKMSRAFRFVEFLAWCALNRIPVKPRQIILHGNKLKADDLFFSFGYGVLQNNCEHLNFLAAAPCRKLFHLSHYFLKVERLATNAKRLNIDGFIAENDLSQVPFFSKYLPWVRHVTVLPFGAQRRFRRYRDFKSRQNKCFATGTIDRVSRNPGMTEFCDYFQSDIVQPMRHVLYENREALRPYLDCFSQPFYESKPAIVAKEAPLLIRLRAKWHNRFKLKRTQYFSFDMVEKLNEYRMFIVPEELSGLPGIGFVEGMSCGSAFVGLRDPMYLSLGMKDGIHFIAYDGTLNDLIEKINYYQRNENELQQIAENGYRFAREHFSYDQVRARFLGIVNASLSGARIPAAGFSYAPA